MSFRFVANDVGLEIHAAFTGKKLAASNTMVGVIATAATEAIQDAGAMLKDQGRNNIAAAGFSKKWQNAWRVDVYPKRGVSINAAVWAYHKIPYSLVFEEGARIRGKKGKLWIPLKTTPVKGIGRGKTTPAMLEQRGIDLFSINRPGKAPLLAANIPAFNSRAHRTQRITLSRVRSALLGRGAAQGKAVRSVPLFVGVDAATVRKRFNLGGITAAIRGQMGALYFARVQAE